MTYAYTVDPIRQDGLFALGLVFLVAGVIFAMAYRFIHLCEAEYAEDRGWKGPIVTFIAFLLISITFFAIDYTTPPDPSVNVKVIGKLQPYSDDVEVLELSGKTKVLRTRTLIYYMVPDGEISFKRVSGVVYPEHAVFYRNKSK